MSFIVQAELSADTHLMTRVAACAATEGVADPLSWVWDNAWRLSARPNWVAKYKASKESGVDIPGWDEDAITDDDIRAAVSDLLAAEDAAKPIV